MPGDNDVAQTVVESTDGVLILPRKLSWTVAVIAGLWLIGQIIATTMFVADVRATNEDQDEEISKLKIERNERRVAVEQRFGRIETDRVQDREATIRMQEQLKVVVDTVKEIRDFMRPATPR